jgi:hypothetical protein
VAVEGKTMNGTLKLTLAGIGMLALLGAASGEETKFRKAGASPASQKRDSGQCWKVAQRTKMTDEQATGNLVTGYLIGGVVGVVIASNSNDDANKNPKSDFRRQVHDECMAKRGYRQID